MLTSITYNASDLRHFGAVGAALLWFALIQGRPAEAAEFDVLNQSKTTIYHLYVSPEGSSHFTGDALGEDEEDALEPGDSVTLRDLGSGRYKFKIGVESDRTCVVPNVLLEEGKTVELTEEFLKGCR